ncbi:hypothetical protein DL95DRAFT_48975 [Leptodontidium sp. 2 PMI_412]|nr:hypothetical protein DL95DRAFT_48975 [Leptodontidium sp. 2 PMI_412]
MLCLSTHFLTSSLLSAPVRPAIMHTSHSPSLHFQAHMYAPSNQPQPSPAIVISSIHHEKHPINPNLNPFPTHLNPPSHPARNTTRSKTKDKPTRKSKRKANAVFIMTYSCSRYNHQVPELGNSTQPNLTQANPCISKTPLLPADRQLNCQFFAMDQSHIVDPSRQP